MGGEGEEEEGGSREELIDGENGDQLFPGFLLRRGWGLDIPYLLDGRAWQGKNTYNWHGTNLDRHHKKTQE